MSPRPLLTLAFCLLALSSFKLAYADDSTDSSSDDTKPIDIMPVDIPDEGGDATDANNTDIVLYTMSSMERSAPSASNGPNSACAGCYSPRSTTDLSVKQAAAKAIEQANAGKAWKLQLQKLKLTPKIKLASIVSASSQVVAGTNYDLVLKVRRGENGMHWAAFFLLLFA